ncbi:MAG: hypothetical protein EA370_00420 [Wenzhouxiangella sp.]|nr:MAG: hypothetical protein EA370_00420 [Wenzhouxiangella sp.]
MHLWSVPGQRVLINGAAGCVGSIATQMAKARGAFVVGVDHTTKLDYMKSLGADKVMDYTQEDVTRLEQGVDLIIDVASTLPLSGCKRMLKPDGLVVVIGHDHDQVTTRRTRRFNLPRLSARPARGLHRRRARMDLPLTLPRCRCSRASRAWDLATAT